MEIILIKIIAYKILKSELKLWNVIKFMNKENIHLIFKEFNCEKIPEELKRYNKNKK